jgi:hypothetical protein
LRRVCKAEKGASALHTLYLQNILTVPGGILLPNVILTLFFS